MKTRFFFLLAAASLMFSACVEPVNEGNDAIKVVQEVDGKENVLANDASITVSEVNQAGQVVFEGYVENISDDYENIKVKVEMLSDGAGQELCQADGTCLPENELYVLATDLENTDIAGFSAHCVPDDKTKAGEFKAVYTFYAEEFPAKTVKVNVTYKYAPAEAGE